MSFNSSRTSKSIQNSKIALLFYFLTLALNFVSRKVFLDHLGVDILGLNTTASNLLSFLNLAELGVGTAVACTLYKPLADADQEEICNIVSLQGWLYRQIAFLVGGGALILMCFFPIIFKNMPLPMWYAYGSFGVLLFSALLGYFVNYKQTLLSADQKEYKITYSYKSVMLLKIICQIGALKYFSNGYVWWLGLEVVFVVVASFALNLVVDKEYPDLNVRISYGRKLRDKYPEVITKIKQLFFHKIATFALSQTSTLIIYAYASLALVAVYGNYVLIITGISALMNAVFNGMAASVGNLVAEGDTERILRVFHELFSSRFLFVVTICFCVYMLTPQFITLWLGSEFLLDNTSSILIVVILYLGLSRSVVDSYIAAYGMFQDVWAPIAEATINIALSVLLGYFYGLHGILSGVLISQLLILFCWKPYFLFRIGLHQSLWIYVRMYAIHILVAMPVVLISYYALSRIAVIIPCNMIGFILNGLASVTIFSFLLGGALYVSSRGFRDFISRVYILVKIK